MKWTWENVFSMDVPEEWTVRAEGGVIEIEPPIPNGAIHISVLRPDLPHGVRSGEATRLVQDFARQQGIALAPVVERSQGDQHVAEGRFETADSKGRYTWDVHAKVWPTRAFVCSLCWDGNDETLERRARRMFDSVEVIAASDSSIHPSVPDESSEN